MNTKNISHAGRIQRRKEEWVPKSVEYLENCFEDAMAMMALPEQYRKRLRTTNSIDRHNKEIRRRERVIRRTWIVAACRDHAGSGGLLRGVYADILGRDRHRDELATAYLQERAFILSFKFTKKFSLVDRIPLVAWDELYRTIPVRVDA